MLKASNLQCGYGKNVVLENINIEVQEGEIFTLVGLNGAGKTTLLKTLLGLIHPLSGSVQVNGVPLHGFSLDEKSSLMTMLEADPGIPFAVTVDELFQIRRKKISDDYLNECLEFFEIHDLKQKNILELSSGQAKRVWLAHLFSLGSQIVLIDEPFAHLDWSRQRKLCHTFKHWQKNHNTTFVLAAHELELVANLSDRMAVLAKNRLVSSGKTTDVLTSKEVAEIFAFSAAIDENPIDGTKRLTLGELK